MPIMRFRKRNVFSRTFSVISDALELSSTLDAQDADYAIVFSTEKLKQHNEVVQSLKRELTTKGLNITEHNFDLSKQQQQQQQQQHNPMFTISPSESLLVHRLSMKKNKLLEQQQDGEGPSLQELEPAEVERFVLKMIHRVKFQDDTFHGLRGYPGESVVLAMQKEGIIIDIIALHKHDAKKQLWKQIGKATVKFPNSHMKAYFGESIAFYFAWMNFYTWWLSIPAVIGGLLYVYSSSFVPLYSVFISLWTSFFLEYWKRSSNSHAYKWGVLNYESEERVRDTFFGTLRISDITGKQELYYPSTKRYLKYCISFPIILLMLVVSICTMLLFLNISGYINEEDALHIPQLRYLRIASANDPIYIQLIPSIFHSVVILTFNKIYRTLAIKLNDWENHRTQTDYENHLVLKLIFFAFFSSYLRLFYLAFVQVNMLRLQTELIGYFACDILRRISTEAILPYMYEKMRLDHHHMRERNADAILPPADLPRRQQQQQQQRKRKRVPARWSESSEGDLFKKLTELHQRESERLVHSVEVQRTMMAYDTFDDYVEMIIQFGYVTIFAAAFPLGALLSFVSNLIEIRFDAFKLCFTMRRPYSRRAGGIGVWYYVLEVVSFVAVLTNSIIFGFTSPFAARHLGGGCYRWCSYVFAIEHLVILLKVIISWAIPDVPGWVRKDIARKEYKRRQSVSQQLQVPVSPSL